MCKKMREGNRYGLQKLLSTNFQDISNVRLVRYNPFETKMKIMRKKLKNILIS